jgi:hypothetical protein
MRAMLHVETSFCDPETFHRTSMDKMFADNLLQIFDLNEAIPDRFGINHNHRSMFALVKAAGLIRSDLGLQPGSLNGVFEGGFNLLTSSWKAAWPGRILIPLVGAYKDMVLKCWHGRLPFSASFAPAVCGLRGFLRQYEIDATRQSYLA